MSSGKTQPSYFANNQSSAKKDFDQNSSYGYQPKLNRDYSQNPSYLMFKNEPAAPVEYSKINAESIPKEQRWGSEQVVHSSNTGTSPQATYLKRKKDSSPVPLHYTQNPAPISQFSYAGASTGTGEASKGTYAPTQTTNGEGYKYAPPIQQAKPASMFDIPMTKIEQTPSYAPTGSYTQPQKTQPVDNKPGNWPATAESFAGYNAYPPSVTKQSASPSLPLAAGTSSVKEPPAPQQAKPPTQGSWGPAPGAAGYVPNPSPVPAPSGGVGRFGGGVGVSSPPRPPVVNGPVFTQNSPGRQTEGIHTANPPVYGRLDLRQPGVTSPPGPPSDVHALDPQKALVELANLLLDVCEKVQNKEINGSDIDFKRVCQEFQNSLTSLQTKEAPVGRFQKYNQSKQFTVERSSQQIGIALLKLRQDILAQQHSPDLESSTTKIETSTVVQNYPSQMLTPSEELSLLADFSYNKLSKSKSISASEIRPSPKSQIEEYVTPTLGARVPENPYLAHPQQDHTSQAGQPGKTGKGYLTPKKSSPWTTSHTEGPQTGGFSASTAKKSPQHEPLASRTFTSLEELRLCVTKPLCERLDFSSRPTKIEVAPDLKNVWYGGEGIGLNQLVHHWFVDQGIVNSELEFCTLKSCTSPSGENLLILNDFRSWDLLVFGKQFDVVHKLKGTGKGAPDFYRSLSTRSWYDDEYIVWLSSPTDVTAVRITDWVFVTAPDFWLYKNSAVQPATVLLGAKGDKLVGLGERDGIHTLHLFGNSTDTIVTELQGVFPEAKLFSALEFSVDEKVVFVGCSEDITCNSGSVYLVAFSFGSDLQQVSKIEFDETREYGVISCMRRHSKNNVLFLGTRVYVSIVAYEADSFVFINQIEVMFEQPVTDLLLRGSLLFVVGDDARGTVIHFDDTIIQKRDPNLNASKIGSYYKRIASPIEEEEDVTEVARSKLNDYVQKKGLSPTAVPNKKKQSVNLKPQDAEGNGLKGFGYIANPGESHDPNSAWNNRTMIMTERGDKNTGAGLMITDTAGHQTTVSSQQGLGTKPIGFGPNPNTYSSGLKNASKIQPKYFNLFENLKMKKVPLQLGGAEVIRRFDFSQNGSVVVMATYSKLVLLEDDGQTLKQTKVALEQSQILDVSVLQKPKRVMVSLADSCDLVVFDWSLNQLARLQGKRSPSISKL